MGVSKAGASDVCIRSTARRQIPSGGRQCARVQGWARWAGKRAVMAQPCDLGLRCSHPCVETLRKVTRLTRNDVGLTLRSQTFLDL